MSESSSSYSSSTSSSSHSRSPVAPASRTGRRQKKKKRSGGNRQDSSSDDRKRAANVVSRLADIERRVVRRFRRALCADRDALTEHVRDVQRALVKALTASGDILQLSLPLQRRCKSREVPDVSVPPVGDSDISGLLCALGRDDLSKRLLTTASVDVAADRGTNADDNNVNADGDINDADIERNADTTEDGSCHSTEMFSTADAIPNDNAVGDKPSSLSSSPNQGEQPENGAAEAKETQSGDAETEALQPTAVTGGADNIATDGDTSDGIGDDHEDNNVINDNGDDVNNDDDDMLATTTDKDAYNSLSDAEHVDAASLARRQNEADRRLLADSDSESGSEDLARAGDCTDSPVIGVSRPHQPESASADPSADGVDGDRSRRCNTARVNYKETSEPSAAQRKKKLSDKDRIAVNSKKKKDKKVKKRGKASDAFQLEEVGDDGSSEEETRARSPAADSHVKEKSPVSDGGSDHESNGDGGINQARQMFSSSSDSDVFTGFGDDELDVDSAQPVPPISPPIASHVVSPVSSPVGDTHGNSDASGDCDSASTEILSPARKARSHESLADTASVASDEANPERVRECRVLVSPLPQRVVQLCRDGRLLVTRKKRGNASKRLSAIDKKINRLMNIDMLLKVAPTSDRTGSDDSSDSDNKPTAHKRAKVRKRTKKHIARLKDMSDGGSSSDDASDTERLGDSPSPSPSRAGFSLSQDRNEFDKQRILNSDSSSEDDNGAPASNNADSDSSLADTDISDQADIGDPAPISDQANISDSADKNGTDNTTDKSKQKTRVNKQTNSSRKIPAHVLRLLNDSLDVTDSSEEDAAMFEKYQQSKTKQNKYDAGAGADIEDNVASPKSDEDGDEEKDVKHEGSDDVPVHGSSGVKEEGANGEQEEGSAGVTASDSVVILSGNEDAVDSKHDFSIVKEELADVKHISESGSDDDFHKKRTPIKRRLRALVDSDSDVCLVNGDQSDADSQSPTSAKRRRKDGHAGSDDSGSGSDSSPSDSGDDFVPEKKAVRRKRVRAPSDESSASDDSSVIIDEDDDVDDEDDDGEGGGKKKKDKTEKSPLKAGRKNIRHIRVADFSTKQASQAEQARKHRIEEKQKMYNQLFSQADQEEGASTLERLILDFDAESKSALVSVHKNFVKVLKPHQVEGIKFMFDSTVETVECLNDEGETGGGGGCILAHCMGLGKTLQVVVLLHTLLQSAATSERICTALVICPKSTVQNWVRELKQWQRKCRVSAVDVVDITFRKDNHARSFALHEWRTEGGVCVLSYDMYKRLVGTGGKKGYNRKLLDRFQQSLVDPGPDIIICDEGHLLKNPKTATFKSLNQVKTMRRAILTGTPLQNNLREYHTMVEFVKPKLLGSESEFSNRFIRPIENGSAVDALPRDVRLMKRRSHVLHKLLDGVVQRRDYNVLTPFLPAKHEYVLMVRLCDVQRQLYSEYLQHHAMRNKQSRGILSDFQALSRIWTHPRSIQLKDERNVEEDRLKGERKAMKSFINDESGSDSSASDSDVIVEPANGNAAPSDNVDWWKSFIPDDVSLDSVELGGKLALLLQVLIKCETIGDKILVFSQSLFSLDLIEEHLKRLHSEIARCRRKPDASGEKHPADVYFGTWRLDQDYFRLDGSVPEDRRQIMCDKMNRSSDERARLMLISTRAGGLGINLVGANRVVIFDASWNPTADSQAIFRVFRFGQMKPCYIYRFLAQGTMEEKIYDRQITKLSLAGRVVDEQQIERHFNQHDVEELYEFEPDRTRTTGVTVPKDDRLLMELVSEQGKQWVSSVHGHDSLLQNLEEEELNAEEQRAAWEEYENDKKGVPNFSDVIPLVEGHSIAKDTVIEMIKRDNPTATDEDVRGMIPKAIQTLRAYYLRRQQQQRTEMEMKYRQMVAMQQMAQLSAMSGLPNLPRGVPRHNLPSNQRYNPLSASAIRSAAAANAVRHPGASSVRPAGGATRPGTTGVNLSTFCQQRSGLTITPVRPKKD